MSNKFGARVIGQAAAEEAQVIEKARAQHFGPRVIGEIFQRRTEIVEEQKDSRSDPSTKQAKREAAAKQRADTKAKEQEVVEAPITANLNELADALQTNPAFYEALFEAEKQRAEGPRKGALRLFLAHELEHEDREDRKAEIEELLGG